jgi:hypothetical protein
MNISPQELAETPIQKVLDWLTIMGQEEDLKKEKQSRG